MGVVELLGAASGDDTDFVLRTRRRTAPEAPASPESVVTVAAAVGDAMLRTRRFAGSRPTESLWSRVPPAAVVSRRDRVVADGFGNDESAALGDWEPVEGVAADSFLSRDAVRRRFLDDVGEPEPFGAAVLAGAVEAREALDPDSPL